VLEKTFAATIATAAIDSRVRPGRRGSPCSRCFWGSAFLFITIGDQALAPLEVSFGRRLPVGARRCSRSSPHLASDSREARKRGAS
jgi:hypothetical protein